MIPKGSKKSAGGKFAQRTPPPGHMLNVFR
jgi:hypothetical protein